MSIPLSRIERVAEKEMDLSAWEIDFIESITARVMAGSDLTFGQQEKFEDIEERLISHGII